MKKKIIVGMCLCMLSGIFMEHTSELVMATSVENDTQFLEPTTGKENAIANAITNIGEEFDIQPGNVELEKLKSKEYNVYLYCDNFYMTDWDKLFEMYAEMRATKSVNDIIFVQDDEQYHLYSKMNSIEISDRDYKFVNSWDNKIDKSKTGPEYFYDYGVSNKEDNTKNASDKNKSNHSTSSKKQNASIDEEEHTYNPNEYYYRKNDQNGDGKMTEQEFNNALRDWFKDAEAAYESGRLN